MDAYDVFYDEIMKSSAATPALARAARWLSASPARTALVGAGAGAVQGAAMHGDDSVASGALKGGIRGAALGAAGGAAGRGYLDTRLLNPALSAPQAVGATVRRAGEGIKRFGQRQLHGFTGAYGDTAGEIGMRGTQEASKRIDLLLKRKADLAQRGELTAKARNAFASKIRNLKEWGREGDAALKAGITSLPGMAKGLVTKPGQTVKAMGQDLVSSAGLAGGAVGVALPTALAIPDIARGDESAEGGRSVRQKLVNLGSNLAGGVATAGLPVIPQIVGASAIDAAASRTIGKNDPSKSRRFLNRHHAPGGL